MESMKKFKEKGPPMRGQSKQWDKLQDTVFQSYLKWVCN
uniref:Uncharacterized protein n=1 Tax=Anguilla anguilla TaxID=7936 RepID=A0A0E9PJN5_ANGAN